MTTYMSAAQYEEKQNAKVAKWFVGIFAAFFSLLFINQLSMVINLPEKNRN